MSNNKTLCYLKKRILGLLDEYPSYSGECFVTDGNREALMSKMTDAIASSLSRMYESLVVGNGVFTARLHMPLQIAYERMLSDTKKKSFTFSFDGNSIAIFSAYYGSGSIIMENAKGEAVFEKHYDGSGCMSHLREIIQTPEPSVFTVSVTDSLCTKDFIVYDGSTLIAPESVPMPAYCSFQLPEDFDYFLSASSDKESIDCHRILIFDGYAFVPRCKCISDEISAEYKKTPVHIDERSSDDTVIDLPSVAFEALCALSASELCREEESGLYTRLYYKYSDLCEALHASADEKMCRNSFYRTSGRRGRW